MIKKYVSGISLAVMGLFFLLAVIVLAVLSGEEKFHLSIPDSMQRLFGGSSEPVEVAKRLWGNAFEGELSKAKEDLLTFTPPGFLEDIHGFPKNETIPQLYQCSTQGIRKIAKKKLQAARFQLIRNNDKEAVVSVRYYLVPPFNGGGSVSSYMDFHLYRLENQWKVFFIDDRLKSESLETLY